jgi:hypothetical protein
VADDRKHPYDDPNGAARFGWADDDVRMFIDGEEVTPRQAREQQLIRFRSQVAEDVAADTDQQPEGNRD